MYCGNSESFESTQNRVNCQYALKNFFKTKSDKREKGAFFRSRAPQNVDADLPRTSASRGAVFCWSALALSEAVWERLKVPPTLPIRQRIRGAQMNPLPVSTWKSQSEFASDYRWSNRGKKWLPWPSQAIGLPEESGNNTGHICWPSFIKAILLCVESIFWKKKSSILSICSNWMLNLEPMINSLKRRKRKRQHHALGTLKTFPQHLEDISPLIHAT